MTLTGHEEEFRRLFAKEAEVRLANLSRQLLELEEGSGAEDELVASVFRDAHNLKGGAAVVQVDEVRRVAHAMEDILEQLRSHERSATPDVIDALLQATDELTAMLPAVLAGEDLSAHAEAVAQHLRDVARAPETAGSPGPAGPASGPAEPAGEPPAGGVGVAAGGLAEAVVSDAPGAGQLVVVPVPLAVAPGRGPTGGAMESLLVPVSRLDDLVRLVGESAAANLRLGRLMSENWGLDPGAVTEFRDLSHALNELQERTMRARMVPVATIIEPLRRAVRDLSRALGKDVRLQLAGGSTELDRSVLQQLADPLLHLVRNAVDHGIEGPKERADAGKSAVAILEVEAVQVGSEVIISVRDDGRGIDVASVRAQAARQGAETAGLTENESLQLVLRSGLSTAQVLSEVSGRGVGLDVVRAVVEAIRGRIDVHSQPGEGTEFRIVVPITLAVLRCLLVDVGGEYYALPMHSVALAQSAGEAIMAHAGGRLMVMVGPTPVPVSNMADVLGGQGRGDNQVVVVVGSSPRHAFAVDRLIGQRDVVVKGLSPLLPRLPILAGASVEPDGSILLVLDAQGLVERARALGRAPGIAVSSQAEPATDPLPPPHSVATILVVDDAAVVRQLERSILERAGYMVQTASDGVEALARLAEARCDLVLTDIEMPRMDGFALVRAIRANARLANIPVVIITARASDESRQRGLDAGADGYVVKSAFDQVALLDAIGRFLGRVTA